MDRSAVSDNDRQDLMQALAELAQIRVDDAPPEQTLRRLAELAKLSLTDALDVSLTIIKDGRPKTVVFTGPLAVDLDERQYERGFGPCVDAAITGGTIVVSANSNDSPYRDFAQVAARAGVGLTVSVGLPIAGQSIGAMNIYCVDEPPSLPAFVDQAEVFAAYAAVVVNNVIGYADAADKAANLLKAMESRAVIEQAKGIIMARNRCTGEEAFTVLRRISQHQNVKLRALAQTVVESAGKTATGKS